MLQNPSKITNSDQQLHRKKGECNLLCEVILGQSWTDTCSLLFGYLLAQLDLKVHSNIAKELKDNLQFLQKGIQEYHYISNQNAVMIVYDLVQNMKEYREGKQVSQGRPENICDTLHQNISGAMENKRYIQQKWQKQASRKAENEMNQRLMLQLLEEQQNERRMLAKQEENKGWQCQICICEIDPTDMGLLDCSHIFHPECLYAHIKASIDQNQLDIRCPLETCKRSLPPDDIFRFIDGELRQKYQKFTFNSYVENNTGSISWCPTAGCTAVFQFDEALDNYRCPACKKHYCLRCRCPFHTGQSCAQYRINNSFDKNDEKFLTYVKGAKYKQCPKCNYWVQRNQGCSTMKCKCGQQFCYSCGGMGCPHGSCNNSGGQKPKGFLGIFGR